MNSGMLKISMMRSLIMKSFIRRASSKINEDDAEKSCRGEKMQKINQKLRQKTPIGKLDELEGKHPYQEKEPLPAFPGNVNPKTGEKGGPRGPEPTRHAVRPEPKKTYLVVFDVTFKPITKVISIEKERQLKSDFEKFLSRGV